MASEIPGQPLRVEGRSAAAMSAARIDVRAPLGVEFQPIPFQVSKMPHRSKRQRHLARIIGCRRTLQSANDRLS